MHEPNISPLARRLAEENNVYWQHLMGTGPEGAVVEKDVIEYLHRVMAGDEAVNSTPEPLPEGMTQWPQENLANLVVPGQEQLGREMQTSWQSDDIADLQNLEQSDPNANLVQSEASVGLASEGLASETDFANTQVPDDDIDDALVMNDLTTTSPEINSGFVPNQTMAVEAPPAEDNSDAFFEEDMKSTHNDSQTDALTNPTSNNVDSLFDKPLNATGFDLDSDALDYLDDDFALGLDDDDTIDLDGDAFRLTEVDTQATSEVQENSQDNNKDTIGTLFYDETAVDESAFDSELDDLLFDSTDTEESNMTTVEEDLTMTEMTELQSTQPQVESEQQSFSDANNDLSMNSEDFEYDLDMDMLDEDIASQVGETNVQASTEAFGDEQVQATEAFTSELDTSVADILDDNDELTSEDFDELLEASNSTSIDLEEVSSLASDALIEDPESGELDLEGDASIFDTGIIADLEAANTDAIPSSSDFDFSDTDFGTEEELLDDQNFATRDEIANSFSLNNDAEVAADEASVIEEADDQFGSSFAEDLLATSEQTVEPSLEDKALEEAFLDDDNAFDTANDILEDSELGLTESDAFETENEVSIDEQDTFALSDAGLADEEMSTDDFDDIFGESSESVVAATDELQSFDDLENFDDLDLQEAGGDDFSEANNSLESESTIADDSVLAALDDELDAGTNTELVDADLNESDDDLFTEALDDFADLEETGTADFDNEIDRRFEEALDTAAEQADPYAASQGVFDDDIFSDSDNLGLSDEPRNLDSVEENSESSLTWSDVNFDDEDPLVELERELASELSEDLDFLDGDVSSDNSSVNVALAAGGAAAALGLGAANKAKSETSDENWAILEEILEDDAEDIRAEQEGDIEMDTDMLDVSASEVDNDFLDDFDLEASLDELEAELSDVDTEDVLAAESTDDILGLESDTALDLDSADNEEVEAATDDIFSDLDESNEDSGELEASKLEASELEASEAETSELETSELETSGIDADLAEDLEAEMSNESSEEVITETLDDNVEDVLEEAKLEDADVSEDADEVSEQLLNQMVDDSSVIDDVTANALFEEANRISGTDSEVDNLLAASGSIESKVAVSEVAELQLKNHQVARRYVELSNLLEANASIAQELGNESQNSDSLEPVVLLAMAAGKAMEQYPLSSDSKQLLISRFTKEGSEYLALENVLEQSVKSVASEISNQASDSNWFGSSADNYAAALKNSHLVVADLSNFQLDELVTSEQKPVLALGRIVKENDDHVSTLSLSGDFDLESASEFLGRVAHLLSDPIRLLV